MKIKALIIVVIFVGIGLGITPPPPQPYCHSWLSPLLALLFPNYNENFGFGRGGYRPPAPPRLGRRWRPGMAREGTSRRCKKNKIKKTVLVIIISKVRKQF